MSEPATASQVAQIVQKALEPVHNKLDTVDRVLRGNPDVPSDIGICGRVKTNEEKIKTVEGKISGVTKWVLSALGAALLGVGKAFWTTLTGR